MAEQGAARGLAVAASGRDKWFRRALFIPTLAFLIIMAIVPLFGSLGIGLTDAVIAGPPPKFVWFRNYGDLLGGVRNQEFWLATDVTLKIMVAALILEIGLGILIALALHEKLPGMGLFRLIIFLPMMLAPLVAGLFWRLLLDQTFGIVDYFITQLGFKPVFWLTGINEVIPGLKLVLISVIIVDVWMWTPFVVLLVLAGLGTIPTDLLEAASLDRASAWMKFRHIYWPYLRFPLLLALLFRSIDTLKMFDIPYILTGGGPGDFTTTLTFLGYRYLLFFAKIGLAAAISWIVVIIINIVTNIAVQFLMPKKP
ncbi:MAG: carbohydrate ABC transporter permease, partial [Anaerolineae bacterium]